MKNVIVIFLDGKEMSFENAYFIINHDYKNVEILKRDSNRIIAIFNFDNIVGVKIV